MGAVEAITQLLYRLALAVDEDDFDLFGTCFTDDATFGTASQAPIHGRTAICDYFRARRQARRSRGEQPRHVISNVVLLEESESEALAVAYVTGLVATGPHSFSFHCGWYRDRLVRDSDGWRITEHFIHADGADPPNPIIPAS